MDNALVLIYFGVFVAWGITIYIREKRFSTYWLTTEERRFAEYRTYGRFVYVFWCFDSLGTLAELTLIPVLFWRTNLSTFIF